MKTLGWKWILNMCYIIAYIVKPTQPNLTRFSAQYSKLILHYITASNFEFE